MSELHARVADVVRRTTENNRWLAAALLQPDPVRNHAEPARQAVRDRRSAGRYAEHRTLKGQEVYYYQGTDFIQEVEEEARARDLHLFDAGSRAAADQRPDVERGRRSSGCCARAATTGPAPDSRPSSTTI
jgi:hypothetical protein